MKINKNKKRKKEDLTRRIVSPPTPPQPPKMIIPNLLSGTPDQTQTALMDERIACTLFHMFVDAILSNEKYKNKSFAMIEIRVSVFMYLQLLKYWGVLLQELMLSDPIYSRIYIDSSLILPVKIMYK